jgi:recombination protein RecT
MTTQTIARAMEKRDGGGLDKLMWAKASHLESILPDHLDVKTFLGTAWAALLANDKLMQFAAAKPETLLIALYRCAAKGHQPGTEEFYLTPRDGGVLGIEGYRGVIERMFRSGAVAKVVVREVCAKDYFRFTEGEDEKPVHHFAARPGTTGADFFGDDGDPNRGDMVGVYGVAQFTTGNWSRPVLLSRNDVFAARASGGWKRDDKYSPWNRMDGGDNHPELQGRSMWWKTAAKRLEPWVPTSAEYRREQLRAAAQATMAPAQPAALAAEADRGVHEAVIVADSHELTTDGALPIENPPDWPEVRKPGSGLPDDTP